MLFNSTYFLIFLALVVFINFIFNTEYRRYFLLAASYIFYWFWDIELSLLLVGSTFVDYVAARVISGAPAGHWLRRIALFASLLFNLGILILF